MGLFFGIGHNVILAAATLFVKTSHISHMQGVGCLVEEPAFLPMLCLSTVNPVKP